MPNSNWHQRATWGMTLGLVAALLLLVLLRPGALGPLATSLEYDTLDFWFSLRDPQPSNSVAILAVDEATLRRWGGRPLDAHDVARLLKLLHQKHARAVALAFPTLTDAQMPGPGAVLGPILRLNGPVCLPLDLQNTPGGAAGKMAERFSLPSSEVPAALRENGVDESRGFSAPSDTLLGQAAGAGHLGFSFDRFGRARRLPLYGEFDGRFYPALALATAEAAGALRPFDLVGAPLLNYPDPPAQSRSPQPFPLISVAAALDNPALLDEIAGRAVVVGPTAPGLVSRFFTPAGNRISLTELHAVALDNLLSGRFLRSAPELWHWFLTIFPAIITGGFAAARRPAWSALVAFLCVITVALASLGLFWQDIWLDTSVPWLTIGLTFLVGVIGRARRQERENTHVASTIDALTKVSDVIAAQSKQWDLLDRVLHWATGVLGASGASALLMDEDGGGLRFRAALGPNSDQLLGQRLTLGEGIAGHVAQTGVPLIINDTKSDARFAPKMDQAIGHSTRNILCVPLRVRDKTLGVLEVVNRENGQPFTPEDADLLSAVANQAAVALENARLYERLNERVERSQGALAVANRQLQADKTLLQTVLHSMTDGVVVTDGLGHIQLVNPAAMALLPELSRGLEQPLARVLEDFPLASLPPSALEHLGTGESAILARGDLDAPRFIEARAAPLQAPDGELAGLVAVFADVTQRRQIEQAKSDFVSFVAHEMRSPLTSISGFSAMMQKSESGGTPMSGVTKTRFLALIHEESERLTRLINNLLDVARLEAGRTIELNRDTVDFGALAGAAIESQRTYSSRHQIVTRFADPLPPIWADADKITQILINLLSNALKYAPGGAVTLQAHSLNGFLEVSVSDEGPGIAPEQQEVLFSRFGRTPGPSSGAGAGAKPTGTGLGLFLTKYLVEAHGGQISVESQAGQGATFRFSIPLA